MSPGWRIRTTIRTMVCRLARQARDSRALPVDDGGPHVRSCECAGLLRQPLGMEQVVLAVDRNIDRVFDMDDATKVRLNGDRIVDIGKNLERYDALDTGMFHCDPILFQWLERSMKNGNCSLSDGMRLMAKNGTFKAFDIGEGYWQDVDTPEAFEYALHSFPLHPELIQNTAELGYA